MRQVLEWLETAMEFDQARHRGVNPVCSLSTSENNNNGVGVKADTVYYWGKCYRSILDY